MLEGRYHKYMDINGSTAQRLNGSTAQRLNGSTAIIRHNALLGSLLFYLFGWISSYAYTPPFKYNTFSLLNTTYIRDGTTWRDSFYSALGSWEKCFQSYRPGFMLDSDGTLYAVYSDWAGGFGGKTYYVMKRGVPKEVGGYNSSTDVCSGFYFDVDELLGCKGTWNSEVNFRNDTEKQNFQNCAWLTLTPQIAQPSGSSSYIHTMIYILPRCYWDASSSETKGRFLWCRINKSNMTIQWSESFTEEKYGNAMSFGGFPKIGTVNSRPSHLAYLNGNQLDWYWINMQGNYNMLCRGRINVAASQTAFVESFKTLHGQDENCSLEKVMKVDGQVYLLVISLIWGTDRQLFIYKINSAGSFESSFGSEYFLDCSQKREFGSGCPLQVGASSIYHADMNIVDGIYLVMKFEYGDDINLYHLGTSKSYWNANYLSWSINRLVLLISSNDGTNSDNWYVHPENIIYVTNEIVCSDALCKNTHKFVVYKDYIIYAYCYPGKSKQLILGAARYYIDKDKHLHLMTKTEFRDKDGNSFGTLTNCDRLVFMDIKNGHLWLAWMASYLEVYYMYVNAQDVIDASV